MFGKKIITGIDVGTYTVRVVITECDGLDAYPRIIGTGIAESRGLRNGYIINIRESTESIKKAIEKAEKAAGVKVRRAFISAGGVGLESTVSTGSTMISRADGETSAADIEKAEESARVGIPSLSNKEILNTIHLGYRLDGKEVLGQPEGMKGVKLEIKSLFITVLSQHLRDLIRAVENADIEIEDIFPSPLAGGVMTLSRQQKIAGCVLANIGAETVSLVVFENGIPISLKVFPIGGTMITNDIALGFRVSLDEAEKIKLGSVSDPSYQKKKREEIIGARLSDIFELIEAHLKKIGRNMLLPAGIIITGGGSSIEYVASLAEGTLKLPSSIARPDIPMYTTDKDGVKKGEVKEIPGWTVAYGLAVLGWDKERRESEFGYRATQLQSKVNRNILNFVKKFLP